VSSTQCLHDVVGEDLVWNSLAGNVLKQRGKDRSLEDLLRQKDHIGGIRVQLPTSSIHFKEWGRKPFPNFIGIHSRRDNGRGEELEA